MNALPTIHIACDHAGFSLKQELLPLLSSLGYTIVDHGTDSNESCDYPLFAHKLAEALTETDLGILLCGTGIGMSMAANRHPHIRAALCTTELHAQMSRRHNNANVLCLGARITGSDLAKAIVLAFLHAAFEGDRHARRVAQLNLA
ncbi:MAG: ribose 5-phosphate isomerase B [Desulfovibrio sp.]|nr:ribose 5-phosphate isomerase B [Desulfovibrio sp.]